MKQFLVEIRGETERREIKADTLLANEDWVMFYHRPSIGGPALEHYRVSKNDVVSIEIVR